MIQELETAVFGGGCFWCTEAIFQQLRGVKSVVSGYAGGATDNPTYDDVCSGTTGHAEVIKIEFDPREVSFQDLLEIFFATHDPTTVNRQGNDVGTQYRSVIFCTSKDQQQTAQVFVQGLQTSGEYGKPIITQIEPLKKFFEAENYHHNYYVENKNKPYCQLVISPKLAKMRQKFATKIVP